MRMRYENENAKLLLGIINFEQIPKTLLKDNYYQDYSTMLFDEKC